MTGDTARKLGAGTVWRAGLAVVLTLAALSPGSAQPSGSRDLGDFTSVSAKEQVSLDVWAFSGFYHDLVISVAQAPTFTITPGPSHVVIPLQFQNSAKAHSDGAEVFVNANLAHWWRFSGGYDLNLIPEPAFASNGRPLLNTNTPENQFGFRSFLNLPRNVEWDHAITYVGAVRNQYVPIYVRLGTRLGRQIGEAWDVSAIGQNLLRPRHGEFPDEYGLERTSLERSVFGKITWHF